MGRHLYTLEVFPSPLDTKNQQGAQTLAGVLAKADVFHSTSFEKPQFKCQYVCLQFDAFQTKTTVISPRALELSVISLH